MQTESQCHRVYVFHSSLYVCFSLSSGHREASSVSVFMTEWGPYKFPNFTPYRPDTQKWQLIQGSLVVTDPNSYGRNYAPFNCNLDQANEAMGQDPQQCPSHSNCGRGGEMVDQIRREKFLEVGRKPWGTSGQTKQQVFTILQNGWKAEPISFHFFLPQQFYQSKVRLYVPMDSDQWLVWKISPKN